MRYLSVYTSSDSSCAHKHYLHTLQEPEPNSGWYIAEGADALDGTSGAGWDTESAKFWVHKLGNLCVLNNSQNSAISNRSFAHKKALLFSAPMDRGIAAGLTAVGLNNIDVFNLAALQERQRELLEGLANRWGVGEAWRAKQSTRGTGPGKMQKL